MPFKSQAQRRKFYAMADRGEISKETLKEWEDATPKDKELPERVKKAGVSMNSAFFTGFEKKASVSDHLYHGAELAGLGVLAAPSIASLRGKPWKEKNKDIAEVAGLGILAAPSAYHIGKSLLRRGK